MSPRRWWVALAIVGAVVLFVGGLLLVIYTASADQRVPILTRDRIAILPLQGPIAEEGPFIQRLRALRRDGSVRGFVIAIDSPGGEVAPSQSIYRELARTREDGYSVVAAIGSLGASGAYYASLGADSILALPGSVTGSIGVIMEFPNVEGLLDKVGIRFEVVKSSEHKDLGSPFRELEERDRMLLQNLVDDVYDQFVDAVVEERGLSRDSVLKVADGRVLSGSAAREYGLIDLEGNLIDAVSVAGEMSGLGPDPKVLLPRERRVSWFDVLTSTVGQLAGETREASSLVGLAPERWLDRTPRLLYLMRQ